MLLIDPYLNPLCLCTPLSIGGDFRPTIHTCTSTHGDHDLWCTRLNRLTSPGTTQRAQKAASARICVARSQEDAGRFSLTSPISSVNRTFMATPWSLFRKHGRKIYILSTSFCRLWGSGSPVLPIKGPFVRQAAEPMTPPSETSSVVPVFGTSHLNVFQTPLDTRVSSP